MPTKSKTKETKKTLKTNESIKKTKTKKATTKSKKNDKTKLSSKNSVSLKTTKKSNTQKKASVNKPKLIEYYDLPNKYNQTIVKVLFQTSKKLFVYWEISESDRIDLLNKNGNDFFEHSAPFLIVKNDTKNYSFEIEINDYANSWYFDVPDSNCKYSVELIRKFNNNSILIKQSNNLEVPNNHILFEQNRKEIFFKNVKTNSITSKNIANLHFINHIGIAKPITLNAFYNKFYDEANLYGVNNPSSC